MANVTDTLLKISQNSDSLKCFWSLVNYNMRMTVRKLARMEACMNFHITLSNMKIVPTLRLTYIEVQIYIMYGWLHLI